MSLDDHHRAAVKVLRQAVATALYPQRPETLTDADIDFACRHVEGYLASASEALRAIISAASEEAVGSAVGRIRRSEGIDPFVVDAAMSTWNDED